MRSVVVVLPASMWAMMPIFLQRCNGTSLATLYLPSGAQIFRSQLPPIVRERLVRFCHAVNIFLLLDRSTLTVGRVQQFICELVDHALLGASTRIGNQPADGERGTPVRIYFDRNLIVRAAHTAALHFEQRLGILDRFLEQRQRFSSAVLLKVGQGLIKDTFRRALLSLIH